MKEALEEIFGEVQENVREGPYTKALKRDLFDPKKEALEFLQYSANVLDRALVTTAIQVLEVEMPCARGDAWNILRVPKSTFRIGTPFALTTVAGAQRSEKAESHIAGLPDAGYEDGECLCYSEKEMVTDKAMRQLGYDLVSNVTSILTRMVNLPIEKAVIDAMKATTCQTKGATTCWDSTTPSITKDIEIGRRALVSKGYPRSEHVLLISDYDYSSIILYLESKGFMGLTFETALPYISKYFDLPILIEANSIYTTPILDTPILEDLAILFARTPKAGVLVESESLNVKTWIDENLEGKWIRIQRECLPVRLDSQSVYTITNTVT